MKAILKYEDDERFEINLALNARTLYLALSDFRESIRETLKYGDCMKWTDEQRDFLGGLSASASDTLAIFDDFNDML